MNIYAYQINNVIGSVKAYTIDKAIEMAIKEFRECYLPEPAPEITNFKITVK